jgi:dihydroneopterin aldolase/D-erythro-7,8-dihydroneopterin triphosphate epimerase
MTDTIMIRDLSLRCIIGINPEEREEKQDVVINVTLGCDCRKAAETDSIEFAVNYRTVKKGIIELVEESEFFLIERLADRIAAVCLDADGVKWARVCVDKPGALRFTRSVAVEITREKAVE